MRHEEKNIGGGAGLPGSDEQKISQLLSDLKRVEAPKDFDFKLKARIANTRPEDLRPASLFPILKYALPLALFLVVGAGVIVNSSFNNPETPLGVEGPASVDTRASAPESRNSVVPVSTPEVTAPDEGRVLERGPQLAVQPKTAPGGSKDFSDPTDRTPPGSVNRALKPAPTPVVPPEFRASNSDSSVAPSEMTPKPLSVQEALESIGIEAEFEDKKWTVKSVKNGTISGLMGVKAGDRLESIDGRVIDDKTVYKDGSFKVKTIRVRRGETAVDLELPKQKK